MDASASFFYNKHMIYVFYFIVIYALIIMAARYDFKANGGDYLIVLGSGLNDNRENFTMINRVNRAARYLDKNPDCKVIVSGGITHNNTVSEASVMRMLLIERNVDPDQIIMEDKSTNTMENMKFSKQFIGKDKKVVVCSSDYHICRAKLLAHKYGYKVHDIFAPSMIVELIYHLPYEEFLIIRDLIIRN